MSMDFLEAVEEQLVAATERGIRRRRWRRSWLWLRRIPLRAPTVGIAAGVGAALAASAIAATLTLPASKPKTKPGAVTAATPGSLRSFTTAGTVPVGFQPESFTAISEFTWWLLGTAPCGRHTCTTIVRTTDGGPQFTRIPAPPTSQVTNLRFANRAEGYAYGQQLWSTRDGGRSWTHQQPGSIVNDLQIAGNYVYAIAYSHGQTQLMSSAVGTNNWTTLGGLGRGSLSGLWVQGSTVFINSGTHLLVSDNGGASFRRVAGVRRAGDCSYDGGPQALWADCSTGLANDEILLSTNSGNTFTTAAQVPNGPIDSFAAATATVAVASGQGPLFRTSDAGASWTHVAAPSANWTYLGFTDATHGVAIGGFGKGGQRDYRLYYTTDGGASYHRVTIGP
jgi:photosystem II stability/assembly factor-like uncharacterized protein